MKNSILIVFCSTVLIIGCNTGNNNNETHDNQTIIHEGNTRDYILYIPASYDSNISTPLIINFHGFGGSAPEYSDLIGDFYKMNLIADRENFIVAYPQAVIRE